MRHLISVEDYDCEQSFLSETFDFTYEIRKALAFPTLESAERYRKQQIDGYNRLNNDFGESDHTAMSDDDYQVWMTVRARLKAWIQSQIITFDSEGNKVDPLKVSQPGQGILFPSDQLNS